MNQTYGIINANGLFFNDNYQSYWIRDIGKAARYQDHATAQRIADRFWKMKTILQGVQTFDIVPAYLDEIEASLAIKDPKERHHRAIIMARDSSNFRNGTILPAVWTVVFDLSGWQLA